MIDIECREEALEYPMESFGEGLKRKGAIQAGPGCTITKRDIKDAFRIVPVAEDNQYLLAFQYRMQGGGIGVSNGELRRGVEEKGCRCEAKGEAASDVNT
jgi:hypothetical protein